MSDTDELNVAKQITEAAVLQLINHWKLDYAPASTVDPNTDQVPTSRAVANYVKGAMRTRRQLNFEDNLDTGFFVSLPTDIYNYVNVPNGHIQIKFEPTANGVVSNGLPPLFANTVFDLDKYTLASNVTMADYVAQPLTDHTSPLMWIFMNDEDNRVAMLYRHVTLVEFTNTEQKGIYLYISALRRSVISSSSVTVDEDPTTAQKNRCRIQRAVCYI